MSKSKYVKPAVEPVKLKTVSARVPEPLYDQFQAAVKIAKENKLDVNITDVINTAMREAIKDVRTQVGVEKCNGVLDL